MERNRGQKVEKKAHKKDCIIAAIPVRNVQGRKKGAKQNNHLGKSLLLD